MALVGYCIYTKDSGIPIISDPPTRATENTALTKIYP